MARTRTVIAVALAELVVPPSPTGTVVLVVRYRLMSDNTALGAVDIPPSAVVLVVRWLIPPPRKGEGHESDANRRQPRQNGQVGGGGDAGRNVVERRKLHHLGAVQLVPNRQCPLTAAVAQAGDHLVLVGPLERGDAQLELLGDGEVPGLPGLGGDGFLVGKLALTAGEDRRLLECDVVLGMKGLRQFQHLGTG